jgi:hypothetical protein
MSKLNLSKRTSFLEVELNGKYHVSINGFKLRDCCSLLICDGKECHLSGWKTKVAESERLLLETENEYGKWFLEFGVSSADGVSIRLSGKLNDVQKNIKLVVMDLPDLQADHLLAQGDKMGGCNSRLLKDADKEEFNSHYQLMLTKDNYTMQMAFPMRQTQPNAFCGTIENGTVENLRAFSEIHNFGSTDLETDALTIKSGSNGFALMENYAEDNLEKEKDFDDVFPAGWNSWDYYRWTINEDEVLKNAEFIASDPVLSKHVKRIIVDDGWQYCYGEWEANHFFPNGMKYLADKITELGFEPGLWFAPTIVEPHAYIAQMDYDMLARGESGNPCLGYECMGRHGFLLDPTLPKVQEYLRKLFTRYTDMGYKYFKLDFMGQTLNARRFGDASVPHSEIPRLIVKSVYEGVANRATILGCNYNFKGGTDFVDVVRIGGDIHAKWQSIKNNTVSVAARFWSNKRLWINDPDFALCRAHDTSHDEDINRLQPGWISVTPDNPDPEIGTFCQVDIERRQSEILLSIVLANGGAVNLSDKMYLLNKSGLDLARRTVSAEQGETAIPLDLFQSELPARWIQRAGDKYRVLLINWNDEACETVFDLKQYGINSNEAVNFWNDQPVEIKQGRIEKVLEPRSCLFAVVG